MNLNLKIAILRSGKKQYEVAKAVGLSEYRLSKIAVGRLDPKKYEKIKLAKILDVKVKDLFPIS